MPTRRRASRGFGLLEVILVFAIVIGAAAVVFSVVQSTQPSSDANKATSDLTTLAANIRSTYLVGSDYSSMSDTLLLQGRLVPKVMISQDGTNILGTWGYPILVQPSVSTNHKFQMVYSGVPAAACTKFVLGAGLYFEDVNVGTSTTSVGTPVRANNQPMAAAMVAAACGAGDPLVVTFTSP
jgi:type II secretory pathway pseudopilin PulG